MSVAGLVSDSREIRPLYPIIHRSLAGIDQLSLQVLDLLAHPFGGRLGIDKPLGNTNFTTLRSQSVELAVDLLAQKIERPYHNSTTRQTVAECVEVGAQSHDLLCHIGAIR